MTVKHKWEEQKTRTVSLEQGVWEVLERGKGGCGITIRFKLNTPKHKNKQHRDCQPNTMTLTVFNRKR